MLDIATAGHIVLRAVSRLNIRPPDIESSLKDIGLVNPGLRIAFREFVRTGVIGEGFRIDKENIPFDEDTTLREIVNAVSAYSLPGDPTTGDDDV